MFFYSAYGLNIQSEFLLPELTINSENKYQADVRIYVGRLNPPQLKPSDSNLLCSLEKEQAYIYWEGLGTILVKQGVEIVIDPVDSLDENTLRIFLLGAAFGLLLHQRGLTVLHGNSININGKGVCFIGNRGFGKSTISAALYFQNYPLISDDVTAVKFNGKSQPYLIPGYGRLKLWSDSVQALSMNPEDLPRVHPEYEKREYLITQPLNAQSIPLKCIYILGTAATISIEPVAVTQALFKVMQNYYCTRFTQEMFHTLSATAHFQECSKLMNHTPVFALNRTSNLSSLPQLVKLIEAHVGEI